LERAQTRVEERNYEIRKHLLEYDDVLNEQRKFIYDQRDDILRDNNLSARVLNAASDIVNNIVAEFDGSRGEGEPGLTSLREELIDNFFYELPVPDDDLISMPAAELQQKIKEDLENELTTKQDMVGHDTFNRFIRFEYLRYIDNRWQDHLENLESLREAVYLRAYGQKNPLLEYKLEGFDIFDQLIQDIRTAIARKVLKVRIQNYDDTTRQRGKAQPAQATHRNMGQFGGPVPAAAAAAQPKQTQNRQAAPEKVTVKRAAPKVGRNDPCPCGSGKKYKYCCGR
jgi:preprotein translocase subunit SecA